MATLVIGLALVVGFLQGLEASIDIVLGGTIVLLPTLWVAVSLTSGPVCRQSRLDGLGPLHSGGNRVCRTVFAAAK